MKSVFSWTVAKAVIVLIGVSILSVDLWTEYVGSSQALTLTPSPSLSALPSTPSPSPKPSPASFADVRVTSFSRQKTLSLSQIEVAQQSFVGTTLPSVVDEVAVFQLKYEFRGKNNDWQPTTARVYVPMGKGEYPLFVFGSGTTGMADKCAPSLENMAVENLGNYANHMITQASQGYTAVFPDYEGFHSADTQAYFVSKSEASVLLGAIKSLITLQSDERVLASTDLEKVFLSGYSQGGHAALSAASEWRQLPDRIKLMGLIEYAGASDVESLFYDSPHLAGYLAESFSEYYGGSLAPSDVLQDKWLQELEHNNATLCVNAAYKHFPSDPKQVYAPVFLDALETKVWPDALGEWQQAIKKNIPLNDLPDVPHLSIQGASDPIVTAQTQKANINFLCANGHEVQYKELPGVNHFQIRQEGFVFSNQWMKDILTGLIPQSNCP